MLRFLAEVGSFRQFVMMLKKLLPVLFLLLPAIAPAQSDAAKERILLFKQKLPRLIGAEKREALQRIIEHYIGPQNIQPDSSVKYAGEAWKEASRSKDTVLQCNTAIQYAATCLQISDADKGLYFYQLAHRLATQLNNPHLLGSSLQGIAQARWYKADFLPAIDTLLLAMRYLEVTKSYYGYAHATLTISNIYGDQGNYEKAFEWAQKALTLSNRHNYRTVAVLSLIELGKLYKNIGDYNTAREYYYKSYQLIQEKGVWNYRYLSACMGDLYLSLKRYDSAKHFYIEAFSGHLESKTARLKMGGYYLEMHAYDSSLTYYQRLYKELKSGGESYIYINSMLGMSKVYLHTGRFKEAIVYAEKALSLARQKSAQLNIRDASEQLYLIHEKLHQPGQAFSYYKLYVHTKDAVITDQFKGKLYEFRRIAEDEKKQAQIALLKKEKLLDQQELHQNRFFKNVLLGGLIILCLLSSITVWSIMLRRKNEKLKNERIQALLQHKATDLEMQALRAQMNPHFIFNCLSSINRFILKNEPDAASDYLTRFSRLIRLVLINSQKQLITLEEEIEMLRLYIEMEQLRFKHAFDYSIIFKNAIEPGNIFLPPMLLQPFCENAIWHGLMHQQQQGMLSISFHEEENTLYCVITDNGIGRAKAQELKGQSAEKIKSLGLQLTTERLALFNEGSPVNTFYTIEDITDEQGAIQGTRVILEIKHKQLNQQPAFS